MWLLTIGVGDCPSLLLLSEWLAGVFSSFGNVCYTNLPSAYCLPILTFRWDLAEARKSSYNRGTSVCCLPAFPLLFQPASMFFHHIFRPASFLLWSQGATEARWYHHTQQNFICWLTSAQFLFPIFFFFFLCLGAIGAECVCTKV